MGDLLALAGLAFLGSVAGLIGGVIFLLRKEWARALSAYSIPFAAGVLLSLSLLDLLPEALEESQASLVFPVVLVSILAAFFLEKFVLLFHHHEKRRSGISSSVPLVIFGDTIHNFLDGVAIAAAYLTEPILGLLVALAAFLHETPHEIADFGILLSAGWERKRAFWANFASALSTFPGAALVLVLSQIQGATGLLLAVAAGLFLYVAVSDFLPEVGEEVKDEPWYQTALLLAGVLLIFLLTRLFAI